MIHLVEKLKEQSSLGYKYAHISCLSPNQIVSSKNKCLINLFSKLCLSLSEQGWITTLCADRAETSWILFVANADVKNQMKEFNMDERLDVFYMNRLSHHFKLRKVMKKCYLKICQKVHLQEWFSIVL